MRKPEFKFLKSLLFMMQLTLIAGHSATLAHASAFAASTLRTAADSISLAEASHCHPIPHWHQWGWGRGCGEITLPRERRRSFRRFGDWRRLRWQMFTVSSVLRIAPTTATTGCVEFRVQLARSTGASRRTP